MSATQERRVFAYGRDHEFTEEEYEALTEELHAAKERGDDAAFAELIKKVPMEADVLMAFGSVYGRSFILNAGFDLTQANMKFGEGWVDELIP